MPHLAVSLSVAMSLISLGMLVYFIDHVAQSIQADSVIAAVAAELLQTIDAQFPENPAEGVQSVEVMAADAAKPPGAPAREIRAAREGYLRFVNVEGLVKLAEEHDLLIRLELTSGAYVLRDRPLATVWTGDMAEPTAESIEHAFVLGPHRTALQDVAFVFEQLVEMAVRALSPSINDPTTASHCIDRIGSGLALIAARKQPAAFALQPGGKRLRDRPSGALRRTAREGGTADPPQRGWSSASLGSVARDARGGARPGDSAGRSRGTGERGTPRP